MGAKTGLPAYTTGSIAGGLRGQGAERESAEALLRRLYPDRRIEPEAEENANLAEAVYPPEGTVYAQCFPGLDVVCDRAVMVGRPSRLPRRYLDAADGRTVVLHVMHSVVDLLAFAVWRDGVLVRSLGVSPADGVVEDIGERFPFEIPHWSGAHPVESDDEDDDPYPLPFHPLVFGEDALRALFGFIVEGYPQPDDVDAFGVPMHRFHVAGPSGPEAGRLRAQRDAAIAAMLPKRAFRREGDRFVESGGV